jgi:hypothetical protein
MRNWPYVTIIGGGILAFILASSISSNLRASTSSGQDMVVQVLGGTASMVADKAYQEADVYYHAGVTCANCPDRVNRNGLLLHAVEQPGIPRPLSHLLDAMHHVTAPTVHRHIQGADEKEVLPWFIVATHLDPHHMDAWLTGTYWFYRTGEIDRAKQFILDGVRHNPTDYRVHMERGILFYRLKQWQVAEGEMKLARQLWRKINEDSEYDKRAIGLYLRGIEKHLNAVP